MRFTTRKVGIKCIHEAHTGALHLETCSRGFTVLALRTDRPLKILKHARLDHSHEAESRKLLAIDVLVIDDFCVDAMDAIESRDVHEILTERDRAGSVVITSNRGPDEWIATFADPVRVQAAIDRFNSNAYDLAIEGESYRKRLKPKSPAPKPGQKRGGDRATDQGHANGRNPGENAPEKIRGPMLLRADTHSPRGR